MWVAPGRFQPPPPPSTFILSVAVPGLAVGLRQDTVRGAFQKQRLLLPKAFGKVVLGWERTLAPGLEPQRPPLPVHSGLTQRRGLERAEPQASLVPAPCGPGPRAVLSGFVLSCFLCLQSRCCFRASPLLMDTVCHPTFDPVPLPSWGPGPPGVTFGGHRRAVASAWSQLGQGL
ncbi:hypothetical protein P7K49_024813 [Saguinus oedipus]|uniref:Uncharacterized protein n=1 Tax=Saguinus oedipus TaxID=9490 RepID=A0ABQ9UQK4_SAGOE|nr:hypothetical protein P7K49_024813 [Saguinus oedipus]